MRWNYRSIIHDDVAPSWVAVHEVYYDEKGEPDAWTAEPIDIRGENLAEVMETVTHLNHDLKLPALKLSELESVLKSKLAKSKRKNLR